MASLGPFPRPSNVIKEAPKPSYPATLDEAVEAVHKLLSEEDRNFVLKSPESADEVAVKLHHSLGRHLRNTFGLWQGSPLFQHLKGLGVDHPDDMSHHIIVAYCQRYIRTRFDRDPPV